MSSDAAIDPAQGEAALRSVQLSEEQFAFYKQVYDTDIKPLATRQAELAIKNSEQNIRFAQEASDNYRKDRERYDSTFRPIEDGLAAEALNWGKDGRGERKAMEAGASVESEYSDAMDQARRNMARQGLSLGSNQLAAAEMRGALDKASVKASAQNNAREASELQGYARRMDASAMGRGVIQNSASQVGLATQSLNNAQQGLAGAQNAQQQGLNTVGQGYNAAIQGNNQASSIFGQMNQQRVASNNADNQQTGQAIGTAASIAAMFAMSDKTKKENIKATSKEKALDGLEKAPVSNWKYKDGVADEGNHTGPMAQDMNKQFGDDVAPDGKKIDIISTLGIHHAAIQGLSDRIKKGQKEVSDEVKKLAAAVRGRGLDLKAA